jgi:secreted trypsin-like serine protease
MWLSRSGVAVLTLVAWSLSTYSIAGGTNRIINGVVATTASYPFVAQIAITSPDGQSESQCAGSLIAPEWILTAAHCFLDSNGQFDATAYARTIVTLGSDTSPASFGAEVFAVVGSVNHPNYDDTTKNNDIALLKLNGRSNLPPVQLQTAYENVPDGIEAAIMGWGSTAVDTTNNTGINSSPVLLEARQQIVNSVVCNVVYENGITDNMLCGAGPAYNVYMDTCQGDSGGPLILYNGFSYVQVGIVSFGGTPTGPACGDPNAPGVYTRVSRYSDFLLTFIPTLTFASLNAGSSSACTGTTIDDGLNLNLACVVLDGSVFSTGLNFVGDSLAWQWNGQVNPSSCSSSDNRCVYPDANLGLSMKGINLGGQSHSLLLQYDNVNTSTLRWNYIIHYAE